MVKKRIPYSEEPPIRYDVAYLREYYKSRIFPSPNIYRCIKCGYKGINITDNKCPCCGESNNDS